LLALEQWQFTYETAKSAPIIPGADHPLLWGARNLTGLYARKRVWIAAAIGLMLLYYTIHQADLKELLDNIRNIHKGWALAVVLASAASYLFIAMVLHRLLQISRYPSKFSPILKITLISCTLNYLMALGGLSGVAAKVYMLSKRNIPPSKTLSISMVHGFLTNTVAVVLVFFGFFFLYSHYKMNSRQIGVGAVILLFALALTWITVQVLLHEGFRKRLWQLLIAMGVAVCHRLHHPQWINADRAAAFFANFNASISELSTSGRTLWGPAVYAFLDWLFMFLTLKCSFLAANYSVSNTTLLVGFSVGIFASLFSLTPASLGIMEGSMAGSFFLMGCNYDRALLATLIYRLAYYLLPILASGLFYRTFFPSAEDGRKHVELQLPTDESKEPASSPK
jgi:glycosyltransferase 2 family protein